MQIEFAGERHMQIEFDISLPKKAVVMYVVDAIRIVFLCLLARLLAGANTKASDDEDERKRLLAGQAPRQ
jgi:hypothetical protein